MITTTQVATRFTTDGVTVEYAYPYHIISTSHLQLTLDGEVFTDWTATKDDPQPGATVTLGSAPASGGSLVITRSTPWTQLVDFTPGEALNAETLETSLDKMTLILQEMAEQCGAVVNPLDAPSNLTATDAGTSARVDLAWTDNSEDEDGFELQRTEDGVVWGINFTLIPANTTSWIDATVSPGTWKYRLRALRAGQAPGDLSVISDWTTIATVVVA